jgi:hypothetical protein
MKKAARIHAAAIAAVAAGLLAGCASPSRMGMVKDPETGLQFGSVVERNLVTDASFYRNKRIKIRTRNTSGDLAFDLRGFTDDLKASYAAKGYTPTDGDDFGLLIDVNVMYSGQAQTSLAREFGFLGAGAGGLAGAVRADAAGAGAGILAGATLGSIVGSYVTEDTYVIVGRITFGEVKERKESEKQIIFSRSPQTRHDKDDEDEATTRARSLRQAHSSGVAVYAGGRNTPQSEIAGEVRRRMVRIVGDFI